MLNHLVVLHWVQLMSSFNALRPEGGGTVQCTSSTHHKRLSHNKYWQRTWQYLQPYPA